MYAPRNPAYKAMPSAQVEGAQFIENDYVVVDEAGEVIAETYSLRKGQELAGLASKGLRYENALRRIVESLGVLEARSGHEALVAGVAAARAIAEMSISAPATSAVQQQMRMPMSAEFRGTQIELLLFPRGKVVDWDFETPGDKAIGEGGEPSEVEIADLQEQADMHMAAFATYLQDIGVPKEEAVLHYGAFVTKVAMERSGEGTLPTP